jgi:hypothetical protein
MPIFSADAVRKKTILLLSGTSEGPILARALLQAGFAVIATVTREAARQHLFGQLQHAITVEVGGFAAESLEHFLAQDEVDLVRSYAAGARRGLCTGQHYRYMSALFSGIQPEHSARVQD